MVGEQQIAILHIDDVAFQTVIDLGLGLANDDLVFQSVGLVGPFGLGLGDLGLGLGDLIQRYF